MSSFFRGCALSAAKIVLKKLSARNDEPFVIRARIFERRFLLSDGQSTMQLMPSFIKHNHLTSDLLFILVAIFIIFGLAEVEDNCF